MNSSTPIDLVILGSGMAGLAAAQLAAANGLRAAVFDKGRRIGGRVSTRRADGFTFVPYLAITVEQVEDDGRWPPIRVVRDYRKQLRRKNLCNFDPDRNVHKMGVRSSRVALWPD